jgi:hypothetical protein
MIRESTDSKELETFGNNLPRNEKSGKPVNTRLPN